LTPRIRAALVLGLLVGASVAYAQSLRFASEVQIASRANPTTSTFTSNATPAMALGNTCGFRVSLCAPDGGTLTGGTLKAWLYNERMLAPQRNTDLDLTVGTPSAACRVWPDQTVTSKQGAKVLYQTASITGTEGDAGSLNIDGGRYTVSIDAWTCP
jgi:hypothetical protein